MHCVLVSCCICQGIMRMCEAKTLPWPMGSWTMWLALEWEFDVRIRRFVHFCPGGYDIGCSQAIDTSIFHPDEWNAALKVTRLKGPPHSSPGSLSKAVGVLSWAFRIWRSEDMAFNYANSVLWPWPFRLDTQIHTQLFIRYLESPVSTKVRLTRCTCFKVANVSYLSTYELWHSFGIRLLFYLLWKASSARKFRCSPKGSDTLSKLHNVVERMSGFPSSTPPGPQLLHCNSGSVESRIRSRPCPLRNFRSIQFWDSMWLNWDFIWLYFSW